MHKTSRGEELVSFPGILAANVWISRFRWSLITGHQYNQPKVICARQRAGSQQVPNSITTRTVPVF